MDPVSNKSSIKFLAFSNDKEDAEKKAKLQEAAAKIEEALAKQKSLNELIDFDACKESQESIDPNNDTRSLYERLMEQRTKKQDAIEESEKLSNLVTNLDEDEINYLNKVAADKKEEEIRKRLEIYDALEERKRLQRKKLENEEQKMKASLINKSNFGNKKTTLNTSLKSKLSTLKVRPKVKADTDMVNQPGNSVSGKEQTVSADKKSSEQDVQHAQTTNNCDTDSKFNNEDHVRQPMQSNESCPCNSSNVTKCLGVLPSLPIVAKLNDSDDDSNDSDDDLDAKLMPRSKMRRRK